MMPSTIPLHTHFQINGVDPRIFRRLLESGGTVRLHRQHYFKFPEYREQKGKKHD